MLNCRAVSPQQSLQLNLSLTPIPISFDTERYCFTSTLHPPPLHVHGLQHIQTKRHAARNQSPFFRKQAQEHTHTYTHIRSVTKQSALPMGVSCARFFLRITKEKMAPSQVVHFFINFTEVRGSLKFAEIWKRRARPEKFVSTCVAFL